MSSVYKVNQYLPHTSSYAVTALTAFGGTASYSPEFFVGYINAPLDNYGNLRIYGAANDFVDIFVSGSTDAGTTYIRTADNGNEPIIFQSHNRNGGVSPVNRVSINYDSSLFGTTRLLVSGHVSASTYTSSIQNGVGFHGTSSMAILTKNIPYSSSAVSFNNSTGLQTGSAYFQISGSTFQLFVYSGTNWVSCSLF